MRLFFLSADHKGIQQNFKAESIEIAFRFLRIFIKQGDVVNLISPSRGFIMVLTGVEHKELSAKCMEGVKLNAIIHSGSAIGRIKEDADRETA